MGKKTRSTPRSLPHAKRQKGLTTKPKSRRKRAPRGEANTLATMKVKRGRGAPRIEIDVESLRPLIALGCSHDEIADCLGISRSTLQLRLAEDEELAATVATMKGERKRNVRAMMNRAAARGNARVLLHMASHELGETPVRAIELSGRDGAPIEVNQEMRPLLERKLAEFIRSKRTNGELPLNPPLPPQIEAEGS